MRLWRWLMKRWRERQRAADLELLWPACYDQTGDLESARQVFMVHVHLDDAWSDLSDAEVQAIVDKLEAPRG